jgi:hypothetical protein
MKSNRARRPQSGTVAALIAALVKGGKVARPFAGAQWRDARAAALYGDQPDWDNQLCEGCARNFDAAPSAHRGQAGAVFCSATCRERSADSRRSARPVELRHCDECGLPFVAFDTTGGPAGRGRLLCPPPAAYAPTGNGYTEPTAPPDGISPCAAERRKRQERERGTARK